jgi:hypothetical protein
MTFKRACSPCLFLCLAALASHASAQNTAAPASGGYTDSTGFATAGDFSGSYLFGNDGGTFFLFDKMVGDGPGYPDGYSRLGMRIKLHDTGHGHLWSSAYALITDHNRVGFNLGGGYRWLIDSNILSLHGWYDSYETDNGFRYDQLSAGIELLHEELDMRVNGYLPIDETENFVGVTDPGTVSTFTSRGIGFFGRGLDEQALKGIDAEVGTAIWGVNWARVYGGGYWYEGQDVSFGGARGRVETAISPDLSLNFIVQNDSEFDTNYQMAVEYRFSGGLSPGFFTPFHGEARKYNPVRRTWPVATRVTEIDTIVSMLNPKTGQAMTATFVDNTNPGAGDGSFENPFSELPSDDSADLILVFAGVGGTTGNITLRDEQQLLGEGKLYTFNDSLRGTVTMPSAFASAGPRPILESADPNQNVITLGNWNRVANFDILGPATAAIGGTNIDGFVIDCITGIDVTDGIRIANASGPGIIRNSGFAADDEGIYVSNMSGNPLNLVIEGGSTSSILAGLNGLTSLEGNDGVHVHANGADVNLTMRDVIVDNAANRGITLTADLGGRLNANVEETLIGNTGGIAGDGFNLNVMSGGAMGVRMDTVAARGNGDLFVVDVQNGSFIGTVFTSDFSDSATGSGVRMNLNNATGRLSFEDLIANRNAVNGIEADATGNGTDFLLSVVDSRLLANMGSGMHIDVMGGADFRHFVDSSFLTLSGGSGLEYNVSGAGSVYIADIITTDLSESGMHAVDGHVFNGGFANVDLMNTQGELAGLNGYNLLVEQNADFVGTVTGAQFTGAADAAIDISAIDGSTINLTMAQIAGQNNGDYGLRYLVEGGPNGGSQMFLGITNADFNGNPDANIVGTSRGAGSVASVYLNNVTADGGGAEGLAVLTAEDGGVLNQQWNGGTASQGDADGVVARVDGAGSQMRLGFNGVNIGTNFNDGIDAMLTNGGAGSLLNISLVNSVVTQNGINGLDLSISGPGARSIVTIDNTPMGGNFNGDAFEFDVLNGAGLQANAFGSATHFALNGERGWHGTVDGAGSFANLFFDGTDVVQNGMEGGLFNVTGGGQLNANFSNLQISQNFLDGVRTNVDGVGSVARFTMDQVLIQQNGLSLVGDGFDAVATNGGQVMATLTNMNVSANRESGLRFHASTGSSMLIQMDSITGNSNGRHGLEYHANSGSSVNLTATTSSFSGNGTAFIGNGVWGTANGAGSLSNGVFQGVVADNNSRMGFEFDVRGGATLAGDIRSNALFGNSSGSGNGINGVRFNAQDAGTMGFLLMSGPNTFDDNVAGDGINFDAVGVNMAVAQVSGSVNNNGADGINIRMINVDSGAIALSGGGAGTITGNAGDGIDITTQNVNLTQKTVNGMLIPDFEIDGFTINSNGGDPIVVNMINTTAQDGEITGNNIVGGQDGINVSLTGGAVNLAIDGNTIADVDRYGIAVTSGSGMHEVSITNNTVTSSGDTNIFVDLFGTTQTRLMIDDNTVIGGGTGAAMFTTGLNFTGSTANNSFFIPPDTQGAVGPDHIVEMLNGVYAVYDKTNGNLITRTTLEQFFIDAGLPAAGGGNRFDPRLVYDPTVNRWFAVGIDAGAANTIFVAVSLTDNPLDGFQGVSFVGDSVEGTRFNDYPTLGIDANGLYIATNNFGGPTGFDTAVYSIPKADLLAAVPTAANLTRHENLGPEFGDTMQGVINFGPADPIARFISTEGFGGGSNIILTELTNTTTPAAILGMPQNIPVPPYMQGPDGRQPAAPPLDNVSPRISGNVVEVDGSIWAVHAVDGSSGNSAIRWYEIDSVTGTVLQTGLLEDPTLDFLIPSIAVNPMGAVVIGFTGTGPSQNPSSMAIYGATAGGVTSFQTPQVLRAGSSSYFEDFGSGVNRWGDYSATVVDPDDPNTFWTFQEYAAGPSTWGVQITEINFSQQVFGGTPNDGIHVDVRENAFLGDSTINGNTVQAHGDDGIEVIVTDNAGVGDLMINGNDVANNGGDGIRFENTGMNQLGSLVISGNMDVSGNVGDGIEVSINDLDPAMAPDVLVEANMVRDNMGDGIRVDIIDSSVDDVSVSLNTVADNLGDGVVLNIDNMTGGVINADAVMVSSNSIQRNAGDGLFVNLNNLTGLRSVDMQMSTVAENLGRGVVFQINNSPIEQFNISDNTIVNNVQDDALLIDVTDSPIDVFTILRNQVGGAADDAIDLRLDGSPVGDLQINNNSLGMVMGMMNSGTPIDDSLPVIRAGFDASNLPANDDGSTAAVPLGFNINFFGQNFAQTFVNNNGNITFTGPLATFTPFNLLSTATPIIAPFFADVDTRMGNIVTYGPGTVGGETAFGVNWPGVRHFSALGANDGLPENIFQLVLINRSDVGVGDFDVEFNYASILWEAGTASGSDDMGLGGSSARAGLSNGVDFALELPGSAINGAFLDSGPGATSLVQNSLNSVNDGRYIFFFRDGALGEAAPSGGSGLEMTIVNGSDIGNMEIIGNTIDGNGAHGVDITVQDSMLPTASTTIVANNTITNHESGDGFRLINPDTNGTPFAIDFTDNTINDNGGVGLNLELNTESGGLTSTLTGNEISGNGGIGASFRTGGTSSLDLTFGDSAANANVLSGNTDAGISVRTRDDSTASIAVVNTMVSGTVDGPNAALDGDGLAVNSAGNSIITSMTVGDPALQNTSFNNNAGNGIDIQLTENSRNPNILIQNAAVNMNAGHGIGITRTGFAALSEDLNSNGVLTPAEDVNNDGLPGNAVITMSTFNGNGGNGLDVSISGSQLPVQQLDVTSSTFNGNTIGMNYTVNNDAMLLVNASNNTINGNTSHGIQVVTNQNSAFGNVLPSGGNPNSPMAIPSTFSSNIITGNGGNGTNFVANNASVQAIDIDDAGAVNASTGTSRTVIDGNAGNQVQITGNGTSQQSVDLAGVSITNVNGVDTGDGVNIDANGTSTVNVDVTAGVTGASVIGAAIADPSVPGLGGGLTADGIAADVSGQAILNLNVSNTRLYNNTGDGINIRNSGPNNTGNQAGGSGNRQNTQATFNNVDARLNGDQGIDVVLDGNIGGRAAQLDTDMPALISINNSIFSSNTNEGIFFRADPGQTHGGDPFYSDLVATFNVTNSMIQGNGAATITDGLVMEIGTNAYVLSNISGNVFGANGLDDFHTNSFDSGPDNNAAALDLRFQNNSGDHIRPTAIGTTIGGTFFVLDNSLTVEANNNFQMFGVPQMEVFGPDGFATNGYILRVISNHGSPTFPPVP